MVARILGSFSKGSSRFRIFDHLLPLFLVLGRRANPKLHRPQGCEEPQLARAIRLLQQRPQFRDAPRDSVIIRDLVQVGIRLERRGTHTLDNGETRRQFRPVAKCFGAVNLQLRKVDPWIIGVLLEDPRVSL